MNENLPKQRKTHQKYSPQFKDQAIERSEKVGVPQAAKDLGIAESLLYSWRAKQKQGGTPLEHQKLQQAEMAKSYRPRKARGLTVVSSPKGCHVKVQLKFKTHLSHQHHLHRVALGF